MVKRVGFLSLVLLPAWLAAAAELVEVSGIQRKIVEPADEHGDLLVSFKASVRNLTEAPLEADIWIQGIDHEGFEVAEVELFGQLKARESRVLTNMIYVREKTYSSVARWQVEEEPSDDEDDEPATEAKASPPPGSAVEPTRGCVPRVVSTRR